MLCTRCGFTNPAGMNFCGQCGGALTPACPQCGFANRFDTVDLKEAKVLLAELEDDV